MGMLDGSAAVVTGAGRGIGRAVAIAMAEAGARVIVNDTGVSIDGKNSDASISEGVAKEIRDRKGAAVANSDSVSTWNGAQKIIQAAMDNFGRIDILVNNAGITRDRICYKLSEEEWKEALDVNLHGVFFCTRAAVPYMRDQKYGRLIHMSSTSGLIGTIGHANYGTAKMAVTGFSRNTAIEMQRFNVTSNCIAPFAWTRLVEARPDGTEEAKKQIDMMKKMSPADAAPLTVFLAGKESGKISGQIFGVRGREIYLFSQPRIQRSVHNSDGWTVDGLAETIPAVMKDHLVPLETSAEYFSWEPFI
jgi:NAD(P)-dependent dehydrogenase (short-subunit alcohol dehydrogenase family)